MTIKLNVTAALQGTETISSSESPASGSGGNTRQFNEYNQNGVALDGDSTPSGDTTPVDLSFTLSGANKDFDLTAVPTAKDVNNNIDLTGKTMVALLVKAASGNNASGITLEGEQTGGNPYDLRGPTGSGKITIYPGMAVLYSFIDAATQLPAVAAGAKDVRFAGTIGDVLEAIGYFG